MSDFDSPVSRPSPPRRIAAGLRRVNRGVGLACGVVLVLACLLIITEIITRNIAFGLLGGTDEIAGYVMAGVGAWAAGYALIERAHIRIDLLHRRLPSPLRMALDLVSLSGLLAVSLAIIYFGYDKVLRRSLERVPTPTANTPLETPLWIPQSIWLAGWCWFAIASFALILLTVWAAALRDWAAVSEIAGPDSEEAEILGAKEARRS